MASVVGNFSKQWTNALRRPSLLWGYGAIGAIGLASTYGILAYHQIFELGEVAWGRFPFVIFAIATMFTIVLARPLWLVVSLHPAPLRQLKADFFRYRPWLATSALVAMAMPQSLQFSSTMKKAIPQIVPFYADRGIADFEYALLGRDAWHLTHAFIGETLTRYIDVLYGLWHLVNIGLLVWLVLTMHRHFQVRAVLTYQLTWILLGGVMATALSSVGPCFLFEFTGDDRFVPLMDRLRGWNDTGQLHSFTAMGYLLASEGTDAFGAGISAMPSLHVAIAFLTVLVVFDRFDFVILRGLAIGYCLVILMGSVHLGWHYLLDGLVSIPLVGLIWWSMGRFVRMLDLPQTGDSDS